MILGFDTNQVYNLDADSVHRNIQIKDIMKTMDNRIKVDPERLKEYMSKGQNKRDSICVCYPFYYKISIYFLHPVIIILNDITSPDDSNEFITIIYNRYKILL